MNNKLLFIFIIMCIFTIFNQTYENENIFTGVNQSKKVSIAGNIYILNEKGELIKLDQSTLQSETINDKTLKLQNIANSPKITLDKVSEKWILTKDTIDQELNSYIIYILNEIIFNLNIIPDNNFKIRKIENIFVMKDESGNSRSIVEFFLYDHHHFTIHKIILDFVLINNRTIINYVNIDISSNSNILNKYDLSYQSQGILSNYDMFDENINQRYDKYYIDNYELLHFDTELVYESEENIENKIYKKINKLSNKHYSNEIPMVESPIFCKKYSEKFDKNSLPLIKKTSDSCIIHNPTTVPYPNTPFESSSSIKSRVDSNSFDWLYNPSYGNIIPG